MNKKLFSAICLPDTIWDVRTSSMAASSSTNITIDNTVLVLSSIKKATGAEFVWATLRTFFNINFLH